MANQAWQIASPGKLVLRDLGAEIPTPGPKQALIRVQAVSLNYRDILVLDHNPGYPLQTSTDLVPCSDAAGVVETVGPDSKWQKGDIVYFHPNTWLTGTDARGFVIDAVMGAGVENGTLRRWIAWDDERLVRAPGGLGVEEVCTLYTAGVTAWYALFYGATKLEPGMTVLTQGTGGVSCYAIMIAAAFGATVVATSSSDEKLKIAKKLGAKHLINYSQTSEWAGQVLEFTGGKGVDIVVEVVGAESIEQSVKATRYGGQISLVGLLSKNPTQSVNVMASLLLEAKTIQGMLGAGTKEMSEELSAFMEKHNLHPPIAQSFDFEDADKAFEAAKKLAAAGKVVIKV